MYSVSTDVSNCTFSRRRAAYFAEAENASLRASALIAATIGAAAGVKSESDINFRGLPGLI
ncbi:MAG: hypothetical protein A3H35_11595 [Betaproteobacteria bacterium RIFCSPLOWO2_02_FULL_62_17]|nr:MAG: hypothetical protein A3H35_11595 [Betaproteobacteria bacterium RIFCSPLOWO2_02_FULL_62_17]